MDYPTRLSFALLSIIASPFALHAQFAVAGRPVQVHGFGSQGFIYSNQNSFLTMKTSEGAGFTDGGANASVQITDRFRAGAQIYVRNVGRLGNWHPTLDWAHGDYKFKDWFGVRAGKVKSALGLFNDTQDMESLHTWALLPQSLYAMDLRDSTIAHIGGDLYGTIPVKRLGSFSYTIYAGARPDDANGGIKYVAANFGVSLATPVSGQVRGADMRWSTPVNGLMAGVSAMSSSFSFDISTPEGRIPFHTDKGETTAYYVDYTNGKLHMSGEYRRIWTSLDANIYGRFPTDQRGWYVSAAYRFTGWLEVGSYNSRYIADRPLDWNSPDNHIYDQAITARFDVNTHWNVKAEGHFMDGVGSFMQAHGFYLADNPTGLQPKTNMLVLRSGFVF